MLPGIRKIVVPVRGDGMGDNVLRHASVLAHRFGAHIEVTHVRPEASDMIPFGVAVPDYLKRQILESASAQADAAEDKLKADLHALAMSLNLLESEENDGSAATVSFKEERGRQVDMISHLGRLGDLICVPQPDRERNLGENTLKAAIFASGRPVMICPDTGTAPASIGARITLGWNGSIEASRALRMSMPLLRAADSVHLLSTGDESHRAATAPEAQRLLTMHGVASEIVTIPKRGVIGERLLEAAEQLNSDLLVMGAYHNSYERQEIFGGNAQSVVDGATLPVVMAH